MTRMPNCAPAAGSTNSLRMRVDAFVAQNANTPSNPYKESPTTEQITAAAVALAELDVWTEMALSMKNLKDRTDPHAFCAAQVGVALQYLTNIPEGTLQHPKKDAIVAALWDWFDRACAAADYVANLPGYYEANAEDAARPHYLCFMLVTMAIHRLEDIPEGTLQHPKKEAIVAALRVWSNKALTSWANNK